MKDINIVHLVASEGKIFAHKETEEILGSSLWLGKEDSADNYIEVDIPVEQEQEEEI